jgi:hypothetical protein
MPSREKLATFAALFAAALSSVATSSVAQNVGDEESGEVLVDDHDQVVRLHVRSNESAQIRVEAEADFPAGQRLDPPVVILVSPRLAYSPAAADAGSAPLNLSLSSRTRMAVNLGGARCTADCEEEVELHFKREAPGAAPMRVHWVVKAGVAFDGSGSSDVPDDVYCDVTKE